MLSLSLKFKMSPIENTKIPRDSAVNSDLYKWEISPFSTVLIGL